MCAKWKIYLSSTFKDLKDQRASLNAYFDKQLENHFELTTIMERMYDDGSHTAFELDCKKAVKDCDIYILIQGNKIGSYPPNAVTTYTEQELDTALAERKKVFILSLPQFDEQEIGAENIVKHNEIVAKFKGCPVHYYTNLDTIKLVFLECLTPFISINPIVTENPYKGLAPFGVEDSKYFFGRNREKEDFFKKIIPQTGNNRFISVIGNSGVGKTSFIQAGVLSGLDKNQEYGFSEYKKIIVTPGSQPYTNLKFQLTLTGVNHRIEGADIFLSDDEKLIIFLNQFEEVITQCHTKEEKEERQALFTFLDHVATNVSTRLKVLIITTFRSDYFSALSNFEFIRDHQIFYPLINLDYAVSLDNWEQSIQEIINEPALKNEVKIEQELVNRLCSELQEIDGSLPILQFTLQKLWTPETIDDRIITVTEYEKISRGKGMAGIIEVHAEDQFEKITRNAKEKGDIIRLIFINLVEVTDNKLDVRKTVPKKDLLNKLSIFDAHAVNEVLETLISKSRLLVITETSDRNNHNVDIIHEVLIRKWDRLKQWVNDRRSSLEQEKEFERWTKNKRAGKLKLLDSRQISEIRHFKSGNNDIRLGAEVEALFTNSKRRRTLKSFIFAGIVTMLAILAIAGINPVEKYMYKQDINKLSYIKAQIDSAGGDLEKVKELMLENDNYEIVLSGLHHFKNLETLTIVNTNINNFSSLSKSSSVRTLIISYNNNLKNLVGLEKFSNLKELILERNSPLKNIAGEWQKLPVENLTLKDLFDLQSSEDIGALQSLKKLTISGCLQNDNLNFHKKLLNLKSLSITENAAMINVDMLRNMPNLTTLELVSTWITNLKGIETLSSLKKVTLSSNKRLKNLSFFEQLPFLDSLEIEGSDSIISSELSKIPQLSYLSISGKFLQQLNQSTAKGPNSSLVVDGDFDIAELNHLKSKKVLKSLIISNNHFDFDNLVALKDFISLRELGLSINETVSLSGIEALEIEELHYNPDSDLITSGDKYKNFPSERIQEIARLKYLKKLYLYISGDEKEKNPFKGMNVPFKIIWENETANFSIPLSLQEVSPTN